MRNKMNNNKLNLRLKIKMPKLKLLKKILNKFMNKTSKMIWKCKMMIFHKSKSNNRIKKMSIK